MAIHLRHGDVVCQHPNDRVLYDVEGVVDYDTIVKTRLRPAGIGDELRVIPSYTGLTVYDGIDGARYEIRLSDGVRFQIRITSKGIERALVYGVDEKGQRKGAVEMLLPIERGKVIVPDGAKYVLRDIG